MLFHKWPLSTSLPRFGDTKPNKCFSKLRSRSCFPTPHYYAMFYIISETENTIKGTSTGPVRKVTRFYTLFIRYIFCLILYPKDSLSGPTAG